MKLSATEAGCLIGLTDEQKSRIVFSAVEDDGLCYDAALVLGGRLCEERADAAAALYHAGRAKYLMPTGGVEWERDGEMVSEAHYLARLLLARGVPEEAILLENEARTTKENMIYCTLQLQRRLRIENVKRVCVVTSDWHLRRSVELARLLLPRTVAVSGFAAHGSDAALRAHYIDRELPLLKKLVDDGLIGEILY